MNPYVDYTFTGIGLYLLYNTITRLLNKKAKTKWKEIRHLFWVTIITHVIVSFLNWSYAITLIPMGMIIGSGLVLLLEITLDDNITPIVAGILGILVLGTLIS